MDTTEEDSFVVNDKRDKTKRKSVLPSNSQRYQTKCPIIFCLQNYFVREKKIK